MVEELTAEQLTPIFGTPEDDVIEANGDNLVFGGSGDDLIDASIESQGSDRIYGGSGDDTFILGTEDHYVGGKGDDRFFVLSEGDNIIHGGEGADQFWIATAEAADGTNLIIDFEVGEDVLGIGGKDIGFEDVSISQQGDNTLIAAKGSDLAILENIEAGSLNVDDFAFA